MISNLIYKQKENFFLNTNSTARGGFIFLILLGIGSFAAGVFLGQETRAWGAFLFNLVFFFSLALGGIAFGNMQDVIGATWGRPIKRLHESYASFIPLAVVLFFLYFVAIKLDLFGAGHVYNWIHDPSIIASFEGKNVWLRPNFMLIRDVIALLVILWLARWHSQKTLAPDEELLAGREDSAKEKGEQSRQKLRYWSAPVLLAYSIAYSLIVFDLTMSLAPTWFSTLWGGWMFSIMMQTLMAVTLLFMFALKKGPLGQVYGKQQFHDVGKLMFGFTAFYAYLTYAHVLTYWYTNIPEETSFFITRLQQPWLSFTIVAPFISFLLPFILMIPKPAKWTGFVAIPVCIIILVAQWLNMMLVVIPEVTSTDAWQMPWIEFGVFLGFLGSFLAVFFSYAKKRPMVNIADPLLAKALSGGH